MMKQELKDKWVEALLSGEFVQGRGRIRDTDCDGNTRYCCLGVLCEVVGLEYRQRLPGYYLHASGEEDGTGNLDVFEAEYGLPGAQGSVLVGMNDIEARTFPEIAEWIEHNVEAS